MKYFLDSAKLDEIELAFNTFGIDGVTTNPRHVQLSGKSLKTVLKDIGQWVIKNNLVGKEKFPISVEINPHLTKAGEMINEAREYAKLSPNFVIKLPCTIEGLTASRLLEKEGIRTNVTLVFSPSQAIPVAKNGAMFVSPFVGWKEEHGDNCEKYLSDIITIYRNYNFNTEIIIAALRNSAQITAAAVMGADIVTCGLAVYQGGFEHPYTGKGLDIFRNAWDNTAKE